MEEDYCETCENTGRVYNNADPTSLQWVPCEDCHIRYD